MPDNLENNRKSDSEDRDAARDPLQDHSAEQGETDGQTEMLDPERVARPMRDRQPQPGTTILSPGWQIRLKISGQFVNMTLEDKITVGRILEDEISDIDLDLTPYGAYHYGVSRRHALMTLFEGSLYLEDLNSTNGTRINGFQLTPRQKYRLRDGDEIEFARLRTMLYFKRP